MKDTEHLDNYRELISEILTCAIEDFVHLRKLSIIRPDFTVNESFWKKRADGLIHKPINIDSPQDARNLVWFFQSKSLFKLCAFIGVPADKVLERLGMAKPDVPADPYRKDIYNFVSKAWDYRNKLPIRS